MKNNNATLIKTDTNAHYALTTGTA